MLSNTTQTRFLFASALLAFACAAEGQTTATGAIDVFVTNNSGISLVFDTNATGVTLGNAGSSASTLNFSTVSAYGSVPSGVTRSGVTPSLFTVGTLFNIQVFEGGLTSTSYRLTAQLAAAAPTGITFAVDGVTLTTTSSTIQTSATYNTDVQHTLNLTISTAAPGAGGPAVGTPLTTTLNFTATAN